MPAPTTGPYLLVQADDTLTESRILASTPEIQLIDSGPGSSYTLNTSRLLGALQSVGKAGFYGTVGLGLESASLVSDGTIDIEDPEGANGNPILRVLDDMTIQKLNVSVNGTPITPARPGINLIPTSPLVVNAVDDAYNNKMDIFISAPVPSGDEGGTVTSVDVSSSSGLVISGSNPITTGSGFINIDLPSDGTAAQVLTYTQASPYTIAWTTAPSSGDITGFGLKSTDQSISVSTPYNPITEGSGSFSLSLNSWTQTSPASNVDINSNEIKKVQGILFSDVGGSPPSEPLDIWQGVNSFMYMNMEWEGSTVNLMPILVESAVGTPAKYPPPSGQGGFGAWGALLFGKLVSTGPSTFVYTQLLPPTTGGVYKLKINSASNGPYWSASSSTSVRSVTLADTSVPATGTGDPIDLGGGSYFVEDPRITSTSVVLANGVAHYDGPDEPAVGPLSVRLNPTTGSGQLPIGYIVYGDPTFDNGKKVSVSVVVY